MNVTLQRRWGSNQAGQSVSVDDEQGRWLVQHNFGTADGVPTPVQFAAAPGTDGPDQLAGGDATRQGRPVVLKGKRRDNNALPVEGSPVQYNHGIAPVQPEARSSKADAGDAPATPTSRVSTSGRKRQAG